VLVVALLLAYLSPETNPNDNKVYALFGVFYPILLLGSLLMTIMWLLVDYKYILISIIGIALGWQHFVGFVNISAPSKAEQGLEVMSYNIGQGYHIRDRDKTAQEKKVKLFKNYLSSLGSPDIICLQEGNDFVKELFTKEYPDYHLLERKNKGAMIFSKYPIVGGDQVDFGTRTNSCVYADVKVRGKTIRVYNMHLQSNQISRDADAVLEQTELNKPEVWLSIKGILGKYSTASQRRALQAEKVKAHAATSPHPVILSGDLNDPPTSYTYSVLANDMDDAFLCKGSGIGTTYGGSIPMLRIDYIMTDPAMPVTTYRCRKEQFSDHYPIFATVELAD